MCTCVRGATVRAYRVSSTRQQLTALTVHGVSHALLPDAVASARLRDPSSHVRSFVSSHRDNRGWICGPHAPPPSPPQAGRQAGTTSPHPRTGRIRRPEIEVVRALRVDNMRVRAYGGPCENRRRAACARTRTCATTHILYHVRHNSVGHVLEDPTARPGVQVAVGKHDVARALCHHQAAQTSCHSYTPPSPPPRRTCSAAPP